MKNFKNIAALFGSVLLTAALTSCGSDSKGDDFSGGVDIAVDKHEAVLEPGQSVKIEILSGNGDYTASIYPEGLAGIEVGANSVTLTHKGAGQGTLIIRDGLGIGDYVYLTLYGEVFFNYEEVTVTAGDRDLNAEPETETVRVTFGMGGYTASSDFDIELDVDETIISVSPWEAGDLTVKVTDAGGYSGTFRVIAEDPFAEFLEEVTNAFTYSPLTSTGSYVATDTGTIDGDSYVFQRVWRNASGSITYYTMKLTVPVAQNLTPGLKENVTFNYTPRTGSAVSGTVLAKVLKNEDGRVWIAYYAADGAYNGRVCFPIPQ